MKTLRDEWKWLLGDDYFCGWPATFFAEYGSYRVVEGVLHAGSKDDDGYGRGRPHIHPVDGPFNESTATFIGREGAHVKLLLPPEEKEGDSLNRKLLQAQSDKRDAQHRADRYEKALREIVVAESMTDWERAATRRRRIAREALDDSS